jgi:peptide/nickel transport system substrate-binding protein
VRFHDGSVLTAADAAASIERLQADASPKADEFAVIEAVETPDESTLVLRLSQPAPALLDSLASGWGAILPAAADRGRPRLREPAHRHGPFVFREWVRDSFLRLAANDDYYHGVLAPDAQRSTRW